jgi:hypothetical protein
VDRALELAGLVTGSDKTGHQLEMMAIEFRSTYESIGGEYSKTKIVSSIISRLQSLMKIKFQGSVTDLESGEIIIEG